MDRILAIASLLVVLGVPPAARAQRIERMLAEVPARDDTLRIVATVFLGQRGDPCIRTLQSVRVVARHHSPQYADSMPPFWREADAGLQAGVDVNAAPVAWGKVRGVVMNRTYVNYVPAEDPLPEWRFLALKGRRLIPVSPWCDAYGQTLPGMRLLAEKSLGWFTALIPSRLRPSRRGGELALAPERDARSGLAMLPIRVDDVAERDSLEGANTPVVLLYREPAGAAGDSVRVTAGTRVEFGRAFAEVGLRPAHRQWGALPPWQVTELVVVLKRLAVVVDGRRGFVDERDFPVLGLETEE